MEVQEIEAIYIEVKINKQIYIIISVYQAPTFCIKTMVDYLDDLLCGRMHIGNQIIILSDFNCNLLKESLPQTNMLLEFIAANQLSQLITEPTRCTQWRSQPDNLV